MNKATTLFKSLHQNNKFCTNHGLLKIELLQYYALLWIHNFDTICKQKRESRSRSEHFQTETASFERSQTVLRPKNRNLMKQIVDQFKLLE